MSHQQSIRYNFVTHIKQSKLIGILLKTNNEGVLSHFNINKNSPFYSKELSFKYLITFGSAYHEIPNAAFTFAVASIPPSEYNKNFLSKI